MHLQTILLFMVFNEVFSYYFYNPSTHDVITRTSLNSIPSGYKLIPPPKTNRKRARFQRDQIGHCTDAGFTCKSPFDKALTFQYECDNDNNCPRNYKCCQQKCFTHKICSKPAFTQTRSNDDNNCNGCNNDNIDHQRPGQCEKWPYNCPTPYDYSLTSRFKCSYDKQCPRSFKCCQQSCFLHKICSRIATDGSSVVENLERGHELNPTNNVTAEDKTEPQFNTESEQSTEGTEITLEDDYESNYDDDTFITKVDTTTDITTETEGKSETDMEEKTNQTVTSMVSEDDSLITNTNLKTEVTSETEETQTTTEVDLESDDYDGDYDDDDDEENEDDDESSNPATEPNRSSLLDNVKYKAFQDKKSTNGLPFTSVKPTFGKIKTSPSLTPHDYNEIVPEYSQYYYFYD